eukprot:6142958-Amphidinium_carterae.1
MSTFRQTPPSHSSAFAPGLCKYLHQKDSKPQHNSDGWEQSSTSGCPMYMFCPSRVLCSVCFLYSCSGIGHGKGRPTSTAAMQSMHGPSGVQLDCMHSNRPCAHGNRQSAGDVRAILLLVV